LWLVRFMAIMLAASLIGTAVFYFLHRKEEDVITVVFSISVLVICAVMLLLVLLCM
jgi:hypothetical protein